MQITKDRLIVITTNLYYCIVICLRTSCNLCMGGDIIDVDLKLERHKSVSKLCISWFCCCLRSLISLFAIHCRWLLILLALKCRVVFMLIQVHRPASSIHPGPFTLGEIEKIVICWRRRRGVMSNWGLKSIYPREAFIKIKLLFLFSHFGIIL